MSSPTRNINVRFPPALHARITDSAAASRRSINAEILYRLDQSYLVSKNEGGNTMSETYAIVAHEGTEYILLDLPDFSGRQLSDVLTEDGYVEFTAPATTLAGDKYLVIWLRKLVYDNGDPIEDLSDTVLDWDHADAVVFQGRL